MIRAVLDVNVLVSAFVWPGSVPAAALDAWLDGRFELIVSEHIVARTGKVWERPYFRARYSAQEIHDALRLLERRAIMTSPSFDVTGVAPDAEDDLVLATAVAGAADYLVTGDAGFLVLGSFRDVLLVTPSHFLELLASREST
jgi:putative PIN family toxin of toxin-antitoxin system